ncbi:MAG: PQQ-binding-like beta-propeller repeat protein [Planctomycetaceae bacterium]|nr:PQQ-binding-like beta-propeller repeat protein [Planctomycetaceae bacterium]
MSPKDLVRFTFVLLAISLLGFGIGGAFGFFDLKAYQQTLTPRLPKRYNTAIRMPTAPPSPRDRSNEGPPYGERRLGSGRPSTSFTGSWSRFRGDHFNAIAKDAPKLARSFPTEGPKVLWTLPVGEGYAGAATRNGRAFILDYDFKRRRDTLRCLNVETGEEIWNFSYPVMIAKNHGVSRTIPAVTDKHCVTIGPMCHVSCVDPATGELLWSRDMVKDYGTVVPQWYAGQCPLIDGRRQTADTLILAPSGPDALLVAIDCETGNELWRTPNPFGWVQTHTSVMPMKLGERDSYVYVGKEGIVGVDANTGEILWTNFDWKIGIATSPSPLILPENRVFLCGEYESNGAMLQITETADGKYEAKLLWKKPPPIFKSVNQTPIFYDGHIFGQNKHSRKFVCFDLNGNTVWESGSKPFFGSFSGGPYMIADGLFLILSDNAELTIVEVTAKEFRPLGTWEILPDACDAWGPMCFVDGLLILRDLNRMVCIDLR